MSTQAAGKVNIVLGMNAVTFTQGIKQAQAELDKFAGKSRQAGHSSVSDMQATSAAIRAMNGGFESNIRSVERWISQSKVASSVAKNMFPVIGAATFGFMIVDLGMKVVDFVQKANAMPKAIQQGFAAMQLASQSSTDSLRLTNDQLQNSINKLEGKPVNNLAIQFDEAAKAADRLATSIESGNSKLNDLLSKDHLSGWSILTGKQGTADREGTIKAFGDQQDSNAYDLANATSTGDKAGIAKAQAALKATQEAELKNLRGDLSNRQANSHNPGALDDSANMNIDKGAITAILNQQKEQAETVRNAQLAATKQQLDDAKSASEEAKKTATARVAAMQAGLDSLKLQYGLSIKATYDYWEQKKSTELAGGTAYNEIVAKQSALAVEGAAKAHATIQKAIADAQRSGADDATTGPGLINSSARFMTQQSAKASANTDDDARGSNQQSIDQAGNTARLREAQITDASGRSMSQYAAALALADVHATQLNATLLAMSANVDIAQKSYDDAVKNGDPDKIRQARSALSSAKDTYAGQQTTGAIQSMQDQRNIDPGFTSATTGATDALNEFVNASRDSAGMMRDIIGSTLAGLNNQVVNAMTGGKTSFRQFGLGVTRDVAGAGLKTAEGGVMSMLGIGKAKTPGTSAGNPLWTKSVDSVGVPGAPGASGGASGVMSDLSKVGGSVTSALGKAGGGVGGFFSNVLGMATKFLPFLATGGPIDGPAIVGEKGPELFVPPSSGRIVPNNQLKTSAPSSSGGGISYSIDARGTDPVQTEQRVRAAIVAAHQSSVKQAVKQVHQQSVSQPTRSR